MVSSSSEVKEQDRNHLGRGEGPNRHERNQHPVKPRDASRRRFQAAEHLGPQVSSQFRMAHRRKGLSQQPASGFADFFVHGSAPSPFSFSRSRRMARQTRDFTPPTEIPSPCAIASYGSSSTSASVAAIR